MKKSWTTLGDLDHGQSDRGAVASGGNTYPPAPPPQANEQAVCGSRPTCPLAHIDHPRRATPRQEGDRFMTIRSHRCRVLYVLASLLLFTACDSPTTATEPERAVEPAAGDQQGHRGDDVAPAQEEACRQYGEMAAAIASDRDRGVPLKAQLKALSLLPDSGARKDAESLIDMLYNQPYANQMTPEGAAPTFFITCLADAKRRQAGAQRFTERADIEKALRDFKTFNKKPLVALLGQYGIKIKSVEAAPVEGFSIPIGQPGDVLFIIELGSKPTKKLPCKLKGHFEGDILPVPEALRHGDTFPVVEPDSMDPLLYWAATGKCSEAFDF